MAKATFGPTFEEMLHPQTIDPKIRQRAVKALNESPLDPVNLYNITWRGADNRIKYEVLPKQLTGVDAPIVLVIRIDPHPVLARSSQSPGSLDLNIEVPLTVSEAILGATIQVPTLEGSAALAIPPGTGHGKKLRLRGMGMRAADGRTGDLYASALVVVPEPALVTPELRAALESLGKREKGPRNGPGWPA